MMFARLDSTSVRGNASSSWERLQAEDRKGNMLIYKAHFILVSFSCMRRAWCRAAPTFLTTGAGFAWQSTADADPVGAARPGPCKRRANGCSVALRPFPKANTGRSPKRFFRNGPCGDNSASPRLATVATISNGSAIGWAGACRVLGARPCSCSSVLRNRSTLAALSRPVYGVPHD
jgi:hypothetical protein